MSDVRAAVEVFLSLIEPLVKRECISRLKEYAPGRWDQMLEDGPSLAALQEFDALLGRKADPIEMEMYLIMWERLTKSLGVTALVVAAEHLDAIGWEPSMGAEKLALHLEPPVPGPVEVAPEDWALLVHAGVRALAGAEEAVEAGAGAGGRKSRKMSK